MPLIAVRTVASLLFLVLAVPSVGQKKPAPKVFSEPPSFYTVEPGYEYSRAFEAINQVDFRNFDVNIFDPSGHSEAKVRLKDGVFKSKGPNGIWVALHGVWYFDFDDRRPHFALINLSWVSSGKEEINRGVLQLFRIDNNHPKLVQQILFSAKHLGAGATFALGTRNLAINSSHFEPVDPNCCPSQQDLVLYRWAGDKFEQAAIETKPLPKPDLKSH
jgi:hypothetical protein